MEHQFDLELRVIRSGRVGPWEVFLENTRPSSRVEDWEDSNDGEYEYFKILKNYTTNDDTLYVYVGCEGVSGGFTSCTVIINDVEQDRKVVCQNTDPDYAYKAYELHLL